MEPVTDHSEDIDKVLKEALNSSMKRTLEYQIGYQDGSNSRNSDMILSADQQFFSELFLNYLKSSYKLQSVRVGMDRNLDVPTLFVVLGAKRSEISSANIKAKIFEDLLFDMRGIEVSIYIASEDGLNQELISRDFPLSLEQQT